MDICKKQMEKKQYNFYYDGGHGWLQVPREDIDYMNLKVSRYSYMDDKYFYLEEDCDMADFIYAITAGQNKAGYVNWHKDNVKRIALKDDMMGSNWLRDLDHVL